MMTEAGVVVRVEADALWVETVQQSTCGACRARSGCGQRLLSGVLQGASVLRVPLGGNDPDRFRLGQTVTIGIAENVIVTGSLVVYLVPLLFMLLSAGVAANLGLPQWAVPVLGLLGLLVGGVGVRYLSWRSRNDERLQPVLI